MRFFNFAVGLDFSTGARNLCDFGVGEGFLDLGLFDEFQRTGKAYKQKTRSKKGSTSG